MTLSSIRPSARVLGATLLTLVLGGAPALAQDNSLLLKKQLTPAQQQKLFSELRPISQKAVEARIAILQKQQQCLAAATTLEALKTCQRDERQASMSERQQHRDALRQAYERSGLPMPQPRPDQNPRLKKLQLQNTAP